MKRRAMALFLCLVCVCAAIGTAAGSTEDSFWWDAADREIVTESCGTGGSPEDAPRAGERGIEYPFRNEGFEAQWLSAQGLQALNAWREDVLSWLREEGYDFATRSVVDGRLYQNVLRGEHNEIDEEEKAEWYRNQWRVRIEHIDLRDDRQLGLSDMFYDGVNYIAYINDEVWRALLAPRIIGDGDEEEMKTPISEAYLRRPFSGFPRDYPYFRVTEGPNGGRMLALEIDTDNPLFGLPALYGYPVIWIPLPREISPYGLRWVEWSASFAPGDPESVKDHEYAHLADPGLYTARVSPGYGLSEEAAGRINEGLEALAQAAQVHPLRVLHDDMSPLSPQVHFEEEVLSVQYYAGEEGEGVYQLALLGAMCFDLSTGEPVDGEALFAACVGEDGLVFTRREIERAYWKSVEQLEPYIPSEQAEYKGVALRWDGMLTVVYQEGEYDISTYIPYELAAAKGFVPHSR